MGEAKRRGTFEERRAAPKGNLTKPKLKWWQTAKWYHHIDKDAPLKNRACKRNNPNLGLTTEVVNKIKKENLAKKLKSKALNENKDIKI